LDEFSAPRAAKPVKPATTKVASDINSTSTTASPSLKKTEKSAQTNESILVNPEGNEDDDDDLALDDEFTKQLAAGMEDLMQEMSGNSELQKSFEEMFKGLDASLGDVASFGGSSKPETQSPSSTNSKGKAPASGASFQERIAQTMDKLKDSSDQVEACFLFYFYYYLIYKYINKYVQLRNIIHPTKLVGVNDFPQKIKIFFLVFHEPCVICDLRD
jgi:hypothetical protein